MEKTLPILAGTDGSADSYAAVRWAAREAAATSRPLMLYSVLGGHLSTWMPASYFADLERDSHAALAGAEKAAREVIGETSSLPVSTHIAHGPPVRALVKASKIAHLLAVGARGNHDSSLPTAVGSTAAGVAAHAHCPVLIIPADAPFSQYRRIAVGIDGTRRNELAIGVAFEEAAIHGAELIAVHTWEDSGLPAELAGNDYRTDYAQGAADKVISDGLSGWREKFPEVAVTRFVMPGKPARALARLSETVDMVVVGSRGRGGFKGMLLGSTSRALVDTARSPLLIVH